MRRAFLSTALVVSSLSWSGVFGPAFEQAAKAPSPPAPAVKVGQAAPDFTLRYLAPSSAGKFQEKTVSLASFKGKNTVILAFFPAAFSPG